MEKMFKKKKGSVANEGVSLIIMIALGVIVVVVLYVIGGVITGSMYQAAESDITSITNSTVKGHIQGGIVDTFETYESSAGYTKITVLAVIGIGIISLMVAGFGLGRMSGGGGATL
jgi:hypothetical protein